LWQAEYFVAVVASAGPFAAVVVEAAFAAGSFVAAGY